MAGKRGGGFYETTCLVHGMIDANRPKVDPQVRVGQPKNKKDRLYGGCPQCKKKAAQDARK